ncbi:malonyl-CoA decarboxylase [Shimia thalassica]|uniref:malonyl-CoA decarboxylase n=1 Tax=Shimia thalassica TaxID=1715693 RepID=UPI0026E22F30|nr:malonyl-CoA decarboxylase [Shimia thalassica]MDO6484767.1 malonyl-CoA decarboxylase [Shimia thalassica]
MTQQSFLSEILARIAGAGRSRTQAVEDTTASLLSLCHSLVRDVSEAEGLKISRQILDIYAAADVAEKAAFFFAVSREFGPDDAALSAAVANLIPGDIDAARALHFVAEPQTQELIRTINRVPGATAELVAMRADLLAHAKQNPELRGLDSDFQHLFKSWFNRGFLEMRQINWSTSAQILEKIITYEAVHEIADWDDLRQRVGDPDRMLFAFFHPAMPDEPLIFVEVALLSEVPNAIGPILAADREQTDPDTATVAAFYSISNCQVGLRGVSFGNFLIKQVVAELQKLRPNLKTFVTLSPVPGLRKWVTQSLQNGDALLRDTDKATLGELGENDLPQDGFVTTLAARFLTQAKSASGTAADPVAHFHLGNGATLLRVHPGADQSPRGIANSWGVMVNYLYDGETIEQNHQAYASHHDVSASPSIIALSKG